MPHLPPCGLQVIASDNGAPPLRSTATVVIKVLDENDNNPQFSHKLFQVKLCERQSTAVPQEVYRMVARDDDEGPNGMITYSLENSMEGQFDIDSATGVVTAKGTFGQGNYSILTVKNRKKAERLSSFDFTAFMCSLHTVYYNNAVYYYAFILIYWQK